MDKILFLIERTQLCNSYQILFLIAGFFLGLNIWGRASSAFYQTDSRQIHVEKRALDLDWPVGTGLSGGFPCLCPENPVS